MGYSKMLRELFNDICLHIEDLFLLEPFQIEHLKNRAPQKEFATLIRKYPCIRTFLEIKDPSIKDFINDVVRKNPEITDPNLINECCDELLWEIADLIVYNKYPGLYDVKVGFPWKIDEIINKKFLAGKVVVDVGAGSGMLAFILAQYAKTVFALEPISSFRDYIREKASEKEYSNIFAIDGFLDSIPFPENSFDILFTSNAIGWNIDKELQEIERVVKPGGQIIHIMRIEGREAENPVHSKLISSEWKYDSYKNIYERGLKLKYVKYL